VDPNLDLYSPTQIDTWTLCKRKWAFKYIEKVETPQNASAALGTEVQDEQLDPYLATGRAFDFTRRSGEIATALAPLLPPPMSPGMKLRRKFVFPSPFGGAWGWQGELDLWAPDSRIVPGIDTPGRPLVWDTKTTGDFRWAKTAEILRNDTQCITYAFAAMLEGADEVDAVWGYTRTRGAARAMRVHLPLAAPHVVGEFERIDAVAREIVTTRGGITKAEELPPSPLACDAFGGCPYRNKCNLSPSVHASAWNEKENPPMGDVRTGSLLDRLRRTPAGCAVPPPAPTTPPESVAPAPAAAIPATFMKPVAPGEPLAASRAAATLPAPAPVNPPESALPPAPPVGAAAPPPVGVATEAPKRGRPRKADQVTVAPSTNVFHGGLTVDSLIDALEIPRAELAALLEAWATKLREAS
jgi:hypothetical protein